MSHGAKLHQNPRFSVGKCFHDLENVSVNKCSATVVGWVISEMSIAKNSWSMVNLFTAFVIQTKYLLTSHNPSAIIGMIRVSN